MMAFGVGLICLIVGFLAGVVYAQNEANVMLQNNNLPTLSEIAQRSE